MSEFWILFSVAMVTAIALWVHGLAGLKRLDTDERRRGQDKVF